MYPEIVVSNVLKEWQLCCFYGTKNGKDVLLGIMRVLPSTFHILLVAALPSMYRYFSVSLISKISANLETVKCNLETTNFKR